MIGRVSLRLRTATECVDLGLTLLRAEWRSILFATMPWMTLFAVLVTGAWWIQPWFGLIAGWCLGTLVQVPAVRIAAARASGQNLSLSWQTNVIAMGRLGLASILPLVGLLVGLLGGPLVAWVAGRVVFLPEVLLVEEVQTGVHARMGTLLARSGGSAVAAVFWWVAILIYGALAAEWMGQGLVADLFQLGHPVGQIMEGELSLYLCLGLMAVHPAWALVRFALYLDLRTRAERLDAFFALWSVAEEKE